MISVKSSGSFKNIERFIKKNVNKQRYAALSQLGQRGVDALASATPLDSGLTASSWDYRIVSTKVGPSIEWFNTNTNDGINIAILIQYGHATGTGGFVFGQDYINPAIRPVFQQIADEVWKEVTR